MADMADIAYDAEIDALQFKRMQSIRYGVMFRCLIWVDKRPLTSKSGRLLWRNYCE